MTTAWSLPSVSLPDWDCVNTTSACTWSGVTCSSNGSITEIHLDILVGGTIPTQIGLFPEIQKRLRGKTIVAHNEQFDRNVLAKTMKYYGLYYDELEIADRWECTCKIYRAKGYKPANLKYCSERNNIVLHHHEALSDARACAQLYLLK